MEFGHTHKFWADRKEVLHNCFICTVSQLKSVNIWQSYKCLFQTPFLDPLKKVTIPLQTAAKLCALNLLFRRDNELQIYHGNFLLMDTIRYDTIRYEMLFNVRSKADINRLNLPHGDDN